jgi:hypothetical protein
MLERSRRDIQNIDVLAEQRAFVNKINRGVVFIECHTILVTHVNCRVDSAVFILFADFLDIHMS